MNHYELTIKAGQLKFFISLFEKDSNENITFHQISREKIKVTYEVVTNLNYEDIQLYVTNRLNELKGLYYLLQIKQINN